jgi:hypothetical protein
VVTVKGHEHVYVQAPYITPGIIEKVVKDETQAKLIRDLLRETSQLKLKVSSVTSTTAINSTTGTGTATEVVHHEVRPDNSSVSPNDSVQVRAYEFKDFQLTAKYRGPEFAYTLDQSFRIVTSTSQSKTGPVSVVKLFQDTPEGPKELKTETQDIHSIPNPVKWWVSPRVQGGLSVDKKGVITFQWLKKGSSKDPKDLRWAVLSPGLKVDKSGGTALLLPISFNFGNLKYQPFSNVWLSPSVDVNKKLGFALTATF